ncbi:MAG: type I-E CRISPR-associated protein Cse1/CasA [Peptoniphilaceae bacterium]|nr:type I-E CRISPR-associated protein Cse1/CasA [Peptoniphilaceae bacterium]MDY6019202.1 type I-E CRISPR-associated protein Cse1/CasA [Anaerococcus sp.]
MGLYNLLEEKWISVISDQKGTSEDVSLIEVFENAHKYLGLAGDSKTQDFALMRVLLAVLHTVFSRFDADGKNYPQIKLDQRYFQTNVIYDEEDQDDYSIELFDTWQKLWIKGEFPPIIKDYLLKWKDHFNLIDEKYPFYQVLYEDISADKINKKEPGKIFGKNINRLISESENKTSLFSPKYSQNKAKDIMTYAEIARWIITFQGYSGLSDKTVFKREEYKKSKGWIFDLGGIYLEGNNLFETLMLNLILDRQGIDDGENNIQKPCWEYSGIEYVDLAFLGLNPDNLSQLYTNWSRAINIDLDFTEDKPFYMYAVKMPDLDHRSYFFEPMTVWRFNNQGENKDFYTPKKHNPNQYLWRSFGLLVTDTPESSEHRYKRPGLIAWLEKIKEIIGDYKVTVNSISMQDDKNATSWRPTDQTYDNLNLRQFILTDLDKNNWTTYINLTVDQTKRIIDFVYKNFLTDLSLIRNDKTGSFIDKSIEKMYFLVDRPFRDWLISIKYDDDKDEKIFEWRKKLYDIVTKEAEFVLEKSTPRDYKGREVKRRVKGVEKEELLNVAIAYNRFEYNINNDLKLLEKKNG